MADAHERILGSLRTADGKGVVRMEDRLRTDIGDAWSALTEPGRLACWLGDIDGDLRLGGTFSALFVASGWAGSGRVQACAAPHHLRVVTATTGGDREHTMEATLTADGDDTLFVLEEAGMPVDLLADFGAGIQVLVEDLAAYLAGHGRCDAGARVAELKPAYVELAAGVR